MSSSVHDTIIPVAQCLRHFATCRKVAGSILDELNAFFFFFNLPNLFCCTRPWCLLNL
jgi:hypothetical protein